jgi:hypothetical protein
MSYHAAMQCRCPDADCTGWRASMDHGGGHVTRERAMHLLGGRYPEAVYVQCDEGLHDREMQP